MGLVLAGSAWKVRRAVTGSTVGSVFDTTVELETAKRTDLLGIIGWQLSARAGSVLFFAAGVFRAEYVRPGGL